MLALAIFLIKLKLAGYTRSYLNKSLTFACIDHG